MPDLHVKVPFFTLQAIDYAAKAEGRTRSNWVRKTLDVALNRIAAITTAEEFAKQEREWQEYQERNDHD